MNGLEAGDKLINRYVRDSAKFVECWVFEDEEKNEYTLCQDQDGSEWIEE